MVLPALNEPLTEDELLRVERYAESRQEPDYDAQVTCRTVLRMANELRRLRAAVAAAVIVAGLGCAHPKPEPPCPPSYTLCVRDDGIVCVPRVDGEDPWWTCHPRPKTGGQ